MEKINEYINYLSSLNDNELNNKIEEYQNKEIVFEELEYYAIDNMFFSKKNYYKSLKLKNILK